MYLFEKQIKSDSAFFFYRGRVALYAILKSMDIGQGDEIIIQAFTCIAVPEPIIKIGAVPIYVDINSQTYSANASLIEQKINQLTKAIIVQHTYGIPADVDNILAIAKKYRLFVIEDCCHSIGSVYKKQMIGAFSDDSIYSFEWGKPLIIGLGGCAIVHNKNILNKMRIIYNTFTYPPVTDIWRIHMQYILYKIIFRPCAFWTIRRLYRTFSKLGLVIGTFKFNQSSITSSADYNKKMSLFHKHLLMKKIKELDQDFRRRKIFASFYAKYLNKAGIKSLYAPAHCQTVLLRYPLMCKNKENILSLAKKKRIELTTWYDSAIHPLNEKDFHFVKYIQGSCPNAEKTARSVVSLPMHDRVTLKQIKKTVAFLKNANII